MSSTYTYYELEIFFKEHHSFLSRIDERFLNYQTRSPYDNATLLYDILNDIAHKLYRYELFFWMITIHEYEKIIRSFYGIIFSWNKNRDVIEMFNYSEKVCFFITLQKYVKRFGHMYSSDDKKTIRQVYNYDIIMRVLEKRLEQTFTEYRSFSFVENPTRYLKIKFLARRFNTFIQKTLKILNRFYLIIPNYKNKYYDEFIHVMITFSRKCVSHQDKIVKCKIMSSYIPLDVCIHVLYKFL